MGLNSGTASIGSGGQCPTFIDRVASSGAIASPGYSIWLDDTEGNTGSLLLGAIDQSRYEGTLVHLNTYPLVKGFRVKLSSISGTGIREISMLALKDIPDEFHTLVDIDPGKPYSYLPLTVVEAIAEFISAKWNSTLDRVVIPCDAGMNSDEEIRFELGGAGGPILTARIRDLVVHPDVSYWELTLRTNDPRLCLFGVQYLSNSLGYSMPPSWNLGSSLLRRTYLAFDTYNLQVAFAPVKFVSGAVPKPEIVPFARLNAHIPMSKHFCANLPREKCVNTVSDETSDSASISSISDSGQPSSASKPGKATDQKWKSILIAVFVPIGIILIALAVFFLVRRQWKQKQESVVPKEKVTENGDASIVMMTGAATVPEAAISRPLTAIVEEQEAGVGTNLDFARQSGRNKSRGRKWKPLLLNLPKVATTRVLKRQTQRRSNRKWTNLG